MSSSLVPVTVIGGYLGAGKTTLVNRLLTGDHGRRLAVIVNDFGAINIDAALLASHDGQTIALENGCVCCSVSDSLGDALDTVLALDPRPDQIVIEASGVADPAKVAVYGEGWPGCRLDGVVVLADVETVRARSDDRFVGSTVKRQLLGADLVVATKIDLVTLEVLDEVRSWLSARTASGVPVVTATADHLEGAVVLETMTARPRQEANPGEVNRSEVHAEELFETATMAFDELVGSSGLAAALDALSDAVVRVKGFVTIDGEPGPQRAIVHRVGARQTITTVPEVKGEPGSLLSLIWIRGRTERSSILASFTAHGLHPTISG